MLRLVLAAIVLSSIAAPVLAASRRQSSDDVYVGGHTRKDGTYVEPYYRSQANANKWDNYDYSGGEKYNKTRNDSRYGSDWNTPNSGRFNDSNTKNDSPFGD